jgi:AraC-like DNA-binding protein
MIEDTLPAVTDALSGALTKMKITAFRNVVLDAGGRWAMDFPAYEGLTLNAVHHGECWLDVGQSGKPIRLHAGDCFLLTGQQKFTLASDLSLASRLRAEDLYPYAKNGLVRCNQGKELLIVGTIFRFEGHLPAIMFSRLPPVVYIAGGSDQAAVLHWTLERFSTEFMGDALGRSLILAHLAPIMLLQALRVYQATAPTDDNWLTALADRRIARVIEVIQTNWQRNWTLAEFASLAGMSRSSFAAVFKQKVGISPMDYLTHWRMQIACDLLGDGKDAMINIATAIGYSSESAFSSAFKKVLQCRPGAYRKRTVTSPSAGAVERL